MLYKMTKQNPCKNIFNPYLSRYILLFFGILFYGFLIGCQDKQQDTPLDYTFNADDITYTFRLQGDNELIIKTNDTNIDANVLLVFLEQECPACDAYYAHLNHLADTEEHLMIFGMFKDTLEQQDIQNFRTNKDIRFPLLNPTSNISLFEALMQIKAKRIQQLIQAIPTKKPDNKEDPEKDSTTQMSESFTPVLPYFVLYDKHHQFYQDYEGIVPEEIFSSDIAQIAH